MKDRLAELIKNHQALKTETWEQLNEINKIDTSKFSAKEKREIQESIYELEIEVSMRNAFISDLESLL